MLGDLRKTFFTRKKEGGLKRRPLANRTNILPSLAENEENSSAEDHHPNLQHDENDSDEESENEDHQDEDDDDDDDNVDDKNEEENNEDGDEDNDEENDSESDEDNESTTSAPVAERRRSSRKRNVYSFDVDSDGEESNNSESSAVIKAKEMQKRRLENAQEASRFDDEASQPSPRKKRKKASQRTPADLTLEDVVESEVNVRCNKDIKAKFGWTKCLLHPPTYRSCHEKFLEFLKMPKEEQKLARDQYNKLPRTKIGVYQRQLALSNMIGADCGCERSHCFKGCPVPTALDLDLPQEEALETFESVRLNCKPSIKRLMSNKEEMAKYDRESRTLMPPKNYWTSRDKFKSWFALPKEGQKTERKLYTKLSKQRKLEIMASIPDGGKCECTACGGKKTKKPRKGRSDKGKKRNTRSSRGGRRRATTESDTNEEPVAYEGMAHDDETRERVGDSIRSKKKWTKRKANEPARTIAQQSDAKAVRSVFDAFKALGRAITLGTTKASKPTDGRLQVFDQSIPRNRFLLLYHKEMRDTKPQGGSWKESERKLTPPEMYYVSSSEEDANHILKLVQTKGRNGEFSKTKIYGSGKTIQDEIKKLEMEWESDRARKAPDPAVGDTAAEVPDDQAPEYVPGNGVAAASPRRHSV